MTAKENNAAQKSSDREIVISRVLDAPRELVWNAFTDPEQVAKWWGPDGFTTTIERMEVQPGGTWKHIMHGPDGKDYPNKSIFKEIVKNERIVYGHAGGEKEGPGATFEATWTFEAQGSKTKLTGKMVFPTTEARDMVVKQYNAVEGAKQHVGRLAEYLAGGGSGKPAFELVLDRVIDAPCERVFEAWAKPDQIVNWFAPKPYVLIIKKMDFRSGGRFSMSMRAPDGAEHSFGGVYREVVPPSKISWTGEFASGPADQMSTVVTFEAQGAKTRLHVCQTLHVMTPEIAQATKGARQGWAMTLDQLEAQCAR